MPRYLVTGGAGFIGSHLVTALLERGDHVVVLDDFSTGDRRNLDGAHAANGELVVVEGSVTAEADVAHAVAECDGVFHLAAVPSVELSIDQPVTSHAANATGTVVVLDAARKHGVKVVYAGSSSVYGDQAADVVGEDLRESPLSPYAAAKLSGEYSCRVFANVYGLPVVVTRFFNVYGPRQVPDSPYSGVVAAFCFALVTGRRPLVYGTGRQSRDFTYVADVARGCILAMDASLTGCHVVNLAVGGSQSVLDILDGLKTHAGVEVSPGFEPARTGDIRHSRADITRARELFGFEPEISLAEGLKRTYDWYRSQYE